MNTKVRLVCGICGEGRLTPVVEQQTVSHKEVSGHAALHYSVCDVCQSEVADAKDLLANKREIIKFKKGVEGIPLGSEIEQLRDQLGITQFVASELFGGGPVAFSKYENDDLMPSAAMGNLLVLAIEHPTVIQTLALRKGIDLPTLIHNAWHEKNEYLVGAWIKDGYGHVDGSNVIDTEDYCGPDRRVQTPVKKHRPIRFEVKSTYGGETKGGVKWLN